MSEKTRQAYCKIIGSKRLSIAEELKEAQLSFEEFKKQGGGKVTVVCELDTKRITALANSSLKEARKLLNSYDVRKGSRLSING